MPHARAIIKTIIACILIYIAVKVSLYFLSPFILSVFICIIIEPIVKILMDKAHLSRSLSIVVSLLFFFIILILITFLSVSSIYNETVSILKNVPFYYEKLSNIANKYYDFFKQNFNIYLDGQNITALSPEKILDSVISILINLKDKILQIILSLPDIIMYISFSLISAFFILKDRNKIISVINKYLPVSVKNIIYGLNKSVLRIARTECILVGVGMAQTIIGLIMLNVDYAVIIGIVTGVLDILPVVGTGIIFVPWIIYSFANGSVVFGISLSCLYIIIIVTRQLLETKFISGNLGLHPLVILISVYLGLKFLGVLGAVLGPLIVVTLKMVYINADNNST